jgi:hypothetical protein
MASIHQVLRCNLAVDLSLDGAPVVVPRFASSDSALFRCGCSIHRVGARITGDDLPAPVEASGCRLSSRDESKAVRCCSLRSRRFPFMDGSGAHTWSRHRRQRRVASAKSNPRAGLIRCACFVVCDHASPSAAVVLHLRPRYVSKAAILGCRDTSCRSKNRSLI